MSADYDVFTAGGVRVSADPTREEHALFMDAEDGQIKLEDWEEMKRVVDQWFKLGVPTNPLFVDREAYALACLKNSGIDTECGECMAVAFTGYGVGAAHTCKGSNAALPDRCVNSEKT